MTYIVGRGIRVEIGKTEGSPIAVSAVSKAKPGVATTGTTPHGLSAKSVGYFTGVAGMSQLDGQGVRLGAVASLTFELEDINTTDFPDYTAGNFVPITAWSTLVEATQYTKGGGDADRQETTVLLDDIKQFINGLLAEQSVTLPVRSTTVRGEAMGIIEDAARRSLYLVFRITFKDGATRVWRGQPSLPGEDVGLGTVGSGSVGVTVKGFVTNGAP